MVSSKTASLLAPLSRARVESLHAFAARDSSHRSQRGSVTYLLLLGSLGFASNAFTLHPALMWTATLAIGMSVVFRFVIHHYQRSIYGHSARLWGNLSRGCSLLVSSCCGLLYASFVILYGYEQWTFVLLMVWITGMLAGTLVTLMADVALMRLYGLAVLIPPLAASLYLGGARGYCYAFIMLVYLAFMFAQGTYIHDSYWQQMVGRAVEAERGEELEQARKIAEEASQAKSRFLANMSHEIRTPMHGVLGVVDILLSTELTAQQRELLGVLNSSAEGLLTVINDILDLSKVEAGKLTFEAVPSDVRALVEEVAALSQARAMAKQLRLVLAVDDALPRMLVCDAMRLRQVLLNLVGNAVKFTSAGSVQLHVRMLEPPAQEHSEPAGVCVRFSVTDTGIGIPEAQQALIFDAFAQADETIHRRFGGTGLGLAISSQILKSMGSKLEVKSEPGKWSEFWFVCELELAKEEPLPAKTSHAAVGGSRSLRILVAEDNPVNQLIMNKTLLDEGHAVVIAANGREAVEAALADDFDVILMDNQMPEMSGMEATGIIKAKRPWIPIIGVSASAMEGDREQFLQAGMDGYVSKPFRLQDLLAAINNCLELKAA